jgi:hypothetical protein
MNVAASSSTPVTLPGTRLRIHADLSNAWLTTPSGQQALISSEVGGNTGGCAVTFLSQFNSDCEERPIVGHWVDRVLL